MKHVGVDSFFAERLKLLNAYDEAMKQGTDDAVRTEHGVTGEAEVRKWLQSFLPKRYGVCKGYIITTNLQYDGPLEEWDVILYDAIESPILFTRGTGDPTDAESKRAIPVEHVRAVVEVKPTFTPAAAKQSAEKLLKLVQYLGTNQDDSYPQFLVPPFVCASVFVETKSESFAQYRKALDNLAILYQHEARLPYMGAIVFRSQKNPAHSGYIQAVYSKEPIPFHDAFEMSSPFYCHNEIECVVGTFSWGVNNYPTFMFDFLASIRGTRTTKASSFYGFDFENVQGSRLFS